MERQVTAACKSLRLTLLKIMTETGSVSSRDSVAAAPSKGSGGPEDNVHDTRSSKRKGNDGTPAEEPRVTFTAEEEAAVDTLIMSVPVPGSIADRITDITATWSQARKIEEGIERVTEWYEMLDEDQPNPVDLIRDHEDSVDAHPWAFLTVDDTGICRAIHTVGTANLRDRKSAAYGKVFGFSGDVEKDASDNWILPNMLEMNPIEVFMAIETTGIATQKACEAALDQDDGGVTFADTGGRLSKYAPPRAFPLPTDWVRYFLVDRTAKEMYQFFKTRAREWSKAGDEGKEAAKLALQFARAVLTPTLYPSEVEDSSTQQREVSQMGMPEFSMQSTSPAGLLFGWAENRVLRMVQPRVAGPRTPPTSPPTGTPPPPSTGTPTVVITEMAKAVQMLTEMQSNQFAREELAAEAAREKEKASKDKSVNAIPEVMLSNLCGFSRLAWDEREELHPLFAALQAAKTQKERYALLKEFFNKLASKEPSFMGFVNTRTFDDIINHKFAPGLTAKTAGEGAGLLAFTPVSLHEVRAAEEEADAYDEATSITTTDARAKKQSKLVPPPASLPELILMLRRYLVFCRELWSSDSVWTRDIASLVLRLEQNQMLLTMDPSVARRVTMQATWAVTVESSRFFWQTTSKEDIDCDRPTFPDSGLHLHIAPFSSGISHRIAGLPAEWEKKPTPPAVPTQDRGKPKGSGTPRGQDRTRHLPPNQGGEFRGAPEGVHENLNGPTPFVNSRELMQVCERIRNLTVTRLCIASGIDKPATLCSTTGTPIEKCLAYNIVGICTFPGCKRSHTNISNGHAEKILTELLPGIRSLLPPAGR